MKRIRQTEVHEFIRHQLKGKLRGDLLNHRILREGDIECCTYSHLRRFLSADSDWRVFAHKHDKNTGYYPDLVICHREHGLAFHIEIKWNRRKISNRDRKKLGTYLNNGARKGYFVTAGPDVGNFSKPVKERRERWRLFVIKAGLKFDGGRKSRAFARWTEERRLFKKLS